MASGVRVAELKGPSARIHRAQKILDMYKEVDRLQAEVGTHNITITSTKHEEEPTRFFVHYTDKEELFRVLETLTLSRGFLSTTDHLGVERGADYL